jgi:transposase
MASRSPASRRNAQNALKLKEQVRKRASAATSPVEMEKLEPIHRRAAGLDIGSAENYVAVPPETMPPGESPVRVFGVVREQQDTWVEWLRTCQVSTAAREATGIYWLTLYDKLEAAGIEGCLVDPHGVKAVPGRKSDWMDCQWLQKLPACGLLPRAFRPDAPLRRLRTLTRPRAEWVCAAASQQQHREKARVCLNLQLGLVVSDLVGETGRAIIRAILAGERDPQVLVEPRNARGTQASLQEMKQARRGPYREEHLFVLQQSVDGWDFLQKQTQACDAKIELAQFYRRMKARKGGPKAVTATARKLACIIYHLIKYQEEFVALDMGKYAANAQAHRLRYLTREAKKLGFELVEAQEAA